MRQRAYTFLVVLLLIFSGSISAQKTNPMWGKNSPHFFKNSPTFKVKDLGYSYKATTPTPILKATTPKVMFNISDNYVNCLGYFCKKEIQFEKATSIPFRFRLGSLEYVNKLEGKK